MDTDLLHAARHLATAAVDSLAGTPGRRITVLRGRLWLTVDHDPADRVLAPGESFTASDARRLTVSAFEPSDYLVLDRAGAGAPPGRPKGLAPQPVRAKGPQ